MPKNLRSSGPGIVAQKRLYSALRWLGPGTAQFRVLGWLTYQITFKMLATCFKDREEISQSYPRELGLADAQKPGDFRMNWSVSFEPDIRGPRPWSESPWHPKWLPGPP